MLLSIFYAIIYFVTCAKIRKAKKIKPNIHTNGAPHKTLMAHCDHHTNGALTVGAPLEWQSTWVHMDPGRHSNGALQAILMAHYVVRH